MVRLVVPENRADPNSQLIALPVIRIRATGSNPSEPIFWFQGGPGISNMIPSRVSWFTEDHDIVLVGYRGIDGSVVLSYPERDELLPSVSNGQQVILSESGHGEFLSLQPEASKHLLTSFYDTGVADHSLYTYHAVDFHVGLGYPAMAKLGLAAIVLIVVIMVAVVWYVVHRGKRSDIGFAGPHTKGSWKHNSPHVPVFYQSEGTLSSSRASSDASKRTRRISQTMW